MPNNERLVAQLQEDLNQKDEQIGALALTDNERELSRRDWFEEAQRLERENEGLRSDVERQRRLKMLVAEKLQNALNNCSVYRVQLTERDALLKRAKGFVAFVHKCCRKTKEYAPLHWQEMVELDRDLSASEYPRIQMVQAHKHTCANVQPGSTVTDVCDCGAVSDGVAVPTERDEREEILPCPFCGENADTRCSAGPDPDWWVECNNCKATAPVFSEDKLDGWNMRAALGGKP